MSAILADKPDLVKTKQMRSKILHITKNNGLIWSHMVPVVPKQVVGQNPQNQVPIYCEAVPMYCKTGT